MLNTKKRVCYYVLGSVLLHFAHIFIWIHGFRFLYFRVLRKLICKDVFIREFACSYLEIHPCLISLLLLTIMWDSITFTIFFFLPNHSIGTTWQPWSSLKCITQPLETQTSFCLCHNSVWTQVCTLTSLGFFSLS